MSINNIPNCLRNIEHEDVLYFTNGDLDFAHALLAQQQLQSLPHVYQEVQCY